MDLHRNLVAQEGLAEREPPRVYAHQGPDGSGVYSNANRPGTPRVVAILRCGTAAHYAPVRGVSEN